MTKLEELKFKVMIKLIDCLLNVNKLLVFIQHQQAIFSHSKWLLVFDELTLNSKNVNIENVNEKIPFSFE